MPGSDPSGAATVAPPFADHFEQPPGDWTWMDNAGGTVPLRSVARDIAGYLARSPVQLGASYAPSREATAAVAAGRRALAALLQADDPDAVGSDEIFCGASTTQLMINLARALQPGLRDDDRIIVSRADHAANQTAWLALGRPVDWWPVDERTGRLEPAGLEALLTPRTRLVCFTHATNITGDTHALEACIALAHAHGALVCVDGVAWAPHRAMHVRDWDVDFYAFSPYKVFGPHCAVLYASRAAQAALTPINHAFITEAPAAFEPGNAPYELVHACRGLPDYFRRLGDGDSVAAGFERVEAIEHGLCARMLDGLAGIAELTLFGPHEVDGRLPIFSMHVAGHSPSQLVPTFDAAGIGLRWGHFYSPALLESLGVDPAKGVLRVSLTHRNTEAEIDRFLDVLRSALR